MMFELKKRTKIELMKKLELNESVNNVYNLFLCNSTKSHMQTNFVPNTAPKGSGV